MIGAIDSDATLLALKVAFLAALYVFIVFVVRSATRELRSAPQESIILSPRDIAQAKDGRARRIGRLLVVRSPVLTLGSTVDVVAETRVGRGPENSLRLDGDEFVSSRHATFEPRTDGLWLTDVGSTNGTFVNGARVTTARMLRKGDLVRIGQTDLEVEV